MKEIINQSKLQFIIFGFLIIASFFQIQSAHASGFNEGGGGGATSTVKLDAFVVNLASYDRFLQATITLKLDKPEVGEKIKTLMPKVRHTVIVILSSKDAETMKTSEGKKELIKELKVKINKILDAKEHEGVADIFLENFVIQ